MRNVRSGCSSRLLLTCVLSALALRQNRAFSEILVQRFLALTARSTRFCIVQAGLNSFESYRTLHCETFPYLMGEYRDTRDAPVKAGYSTIATQNDTRYLASSSFLKVSILQDSFMSSTLELRLGESPYWEAEVNSLLRPPATSSWLFERRRVLEIRKPKITNKDHYCNRHVSERTMHRGR